MSRIATVWSPWANEPAASGDGSLDELRVGALARGTSAFPPVNLWENEKGLVLTAELPGLDASQLDVSLEKDSLTISGGRAGEPGKTEGEDHIRRERWYEPFKRTIELPFDVDPEKCDASYEKGVLTVRLERRPEIQPKKLTIKAG